MAGLTIARSVEADRTCQAVYNLACRWFRGGNGATGIFRVGRAFASRLLVCTDLNERILIGGSGLARFSQRHGHCLQSSHTYSSEGLGKRSFSRPNVVAFGVFVLNWLR